ncbi:MAG TPA: site-2 protease family protein, partial [Fimbriimonas sp.]|nr:site-2 protease family protein [Fimbriimonas sp.]
IGWGKPVMVRPDKMRNPRWDHFVSVLAGPAMNFLQAVGYAFLLRLLATAGLFNGGNLAFLYLFLLLGVAINVSLMLFNLIPIGPLDGHWLVGAFMPEPMQLRWYQFNRGIGSIVFLLLVLIPRGSEFDILGRYFGPFVMRVTAFFLGESMQ